MPTKYTFICESEEGNTVKSFTPKSESWDVPLAEFFLFLKGCGFLFKVEEELVVFNNETEEARESFL